MPAAAASVRFPGPLSVPVKVVVPPFVTVKVFPTVKVPLPWSVRSLVPPMVAEPVTA